MFLPLAGLLVGVLAGLVLNVNVGFEFTRYTAVAILDSLHLVYPDGARDAESLVVDFAGTIWIVSKELLQAPRLYRLVAGPWGGARPRSRARRARRRPSRIAPEARAARCQAHSRSHGSTTSRRNRPAIRHGSRWRGRSD